MSHLRFRQFDRLLMEVSHIHHLAQNIAGKIMSDKCDGFSCRNELLADAITANLLSLGLEVQRTFEKGDPRHHIWIERG